MNLTHKVKLMCVRAPLSIRDRMLTHFKSKREITTPSVPASRATTRTQSPARTPAASVISASECASTNQEMSGFETVTGKKKRKGKRKRTRWRKKSFQWMREAVCKEKLSQHFAEKKSQSMCVFSPDYDGYLSIITCPRSKRIIRACFPDDKEYYEKITLPIKQLVKKLDETYDCVNVVCGSARQNVSTDDHNRLVQSRQYAGYPKLKMKKDEGSVFSDLEKFVSMLQDDEDYISKWELWKLLFPDGENKEGTSWKNPSISLIGLDVLKQNLIEFQIKKAVIKYGNKFDFVFVDDREDILEALKKMLDNKPEWLPSSVSVYLYRYDFFELAVEKNEEAFNLYAKIN